MSAPRLPEIKPSGDIAVPVKKARQQLQEKGYAVVRGAITPEKVEELKQELYDELARLGTGIHVEDSSSFKNANMPGVFSVGIFKDPAAGWAWGRFMFQCREAALSVFQEFWGEKDLITSLDVAGIFRNYRIESLKGTKTKSVWLHVDQGAKSGKEFKCVQGMVNLFPADASTGGLVVVPGSHLTLQQTLKYAKDEKRASKTNYVPVRMEDPEFVEYVERSGGLKLVEAQPGDIILWDSRTIHCNTPSLSDETCSTSQHARKKPRLGPADGDHEQEEFPILRAVAYVCFLPRSMGQDEETKAFRQKAFQGKFPCNHWPNKPGIKREHLAYPRHRSFKSLQSVAMESEVISEKYGHML